MGNTPMMLFLTSAMRKHFPLHSWKQSSLWRLSLSVLCGFPQKSGGGGLQKLVRVPASSLISQVTLDNRLLFCSLGLNSLLCNMGEDNNPRCKEVRNTQRLSRAGPHYCRQSSPRFMFSGSSSFKNILPHPVSC